MRFEFDVEFDFEFDFEFEIAVSGFPSMVENEGLYILALNHLTARLYTEVGSSSGARGGIRVARPRYGRATAAAAAHDIRQSSLLNELDPLRDEGLELTMRISKLGNEGHVKVAKRTCQATEII